MDRKICYYCKTENAKRYIKWVREGEYKNKLLCSKHYHQLFRNGVIFESPFDPNTINIFDTHAEIVLRDKYGNVVGTSLIDLEDVDIAKGYKWHKDSVNEYCVGRMIGTSSGNKVRLHRLILNIEDDSIVDHSNRNRLDNRKSNLRVCTHTENIRNASLQERSVSGFIGVTYSKDRSKWVAQIVVDKKTIPLGRYIDKYDAIVARLKAERKYFKEFAPQQHLFEEYLGDDE